MKLKYTVPVFIAFVSIFASTYGASALYKKREEVDIYYENKIEKNNEKYESIIYKKRIIAEEKIRYEKEQERKRKEEAEEKELTRRTALKEANSARERAAASIAAAQVLQQRIADQNAALLRAEERARVAAQKKSRRSRAS